MSIWFVPESSSTWPLVSLYCLFPARTFVCLIAFHHVDGVAPRAKMNQQRARRFRASQLAQIEHDAADRVAKELAGRVAQLKK